ncbi:MAG: hypothetical protein JWM68_5136 [Verrucomicrobiales bacterium]|nr:hypothetical protein [Verrucomicrobiales bacterium]
MNPAAIILILLGFVVCGSALVCTVRLYLFSCELTNPRPLRASVFLLGGTALITGLQFVFPEILSSLRRNAEGLRAGEWWRIVTPLFVQSGGWGHACVNGIAALIFCPLGERLYGKGMLALYFIPGLVGEIVGYSWVPDGAGSSLGICGVMGGLLTLAYLHRQQIPGPTGIFVMAGLCGAMILSLLRDLHGPSILAGALLASMMPSRPGLVPKFTAPGRQTTKV